MSDDQVIPIRQSGRRGRAPAGLPDEALHSRTRRAQPGARAVAAEQAGEDRRRYAAAQSRQKKEKLIAAGRVVPARITIALDLRGLEGPEVDEACGTWEGNPDGDVDRWELALAVPSAEQVRLLSDLTGFPEAFFYKPMKPGPVPGDGPIWVCWGGRRGCEPVDPDVVDERGVLLYGGLPRTLPDAVQGELFSGGPRPEPKRPRTAAPPRTSPPRKKPMPPEQPTLPNRMPDHLRAELMTKLAANRQD